SVLRQEQAERRDMTRESGGSRILSSFVSRTACEPGTADCYLRRVAAAGIMRQATAISQNPQYCRRMIQRDTLQRASVCPLDCPDACSLAVTLEDGVTVKLDGSRANPVTAGYICGKVRHFPDLVYGERRVRYPALRDGPKGSGQFRRVSWDEALDH